MAHAISPGADSGTSAMDDLALVLNAGSSSLKFAGFRPSARGPGAVAARGQVEGIGTAPRMSARDGAGALIETPAAGSAVRDGRTALAHVSEWLRAAFCG